MRVLISSENLDKYKKLTKTFSDIGAIIDSVDSCEEAIDYADLRIYDLCIVSEETVKHTKELNAILVAMRKQNKNSVCIFGLESFSAEFETKLLRLGFDDVTVNKRGDEVLAQRVKSRMKDLIIDELKCGQFTINFKKKTVFVGNTKINIHSKPFKVLSYLARKKGTVVSKEMLLHSVWEDPEYISENVVEVTINNIRRELEKLNLNSIETIRRKGYRFSKDAFQ